MEERVYGLLGRKLGHSWSVPIHAALGNGAYRLLELEPEDLAPFLRRDDIGGLNVTIPYKRDVMPLCDAIDPAAEAIGSVNTLVRRPDGALVGYNTDIDGFRYMARRAGILHDCTKYLELEDQPFTSEESSKAWLTGRYTLPPSLTVSLNIFLAADLTM